MQCKLKSKLDPPKPICTTTTYPPLSPRVVATGERGQPQGVVGGGKLAAVGDHNLQWHRGRWAAPLPTTRSAHHHSSSQTAGETQVRPRRPTTTTGLRQPRLRMAAPGGLRCRLATSTTHCGAPSLPGRCGRAGRAATLLSVAARCGPAPPIMVATASTRRRRGPRRRHNPPQPHLSAAVESRPPHTAVQPQKSARCSHQR